MTPAIPDAAVQAVENELRSIICEWDRRREFFNVSPSPKNDFMRRQAEGLTARILSAIEPALIVKAVNAHDPAFKALREAYTALAFAFNRLSSSARSRDGELCRDFGKVRGNIETVFRNAGEKL